MRPRCNETVSDPGGWTRHRCRNPGKYTSLKCGVHDPQKIKERAKRRGPSKCAARKARKAERIERAAKEITRHIKTARCPAIQSKIEDILKEVFGE